MDQCSSAAPPQADKGKAASPAPLTRGSSAVPPQADKGKAASPAPRTRGSSAVPPQADKGKAASPAPRTRAAQQCPRRQTRERPPPLLHGPVQLSSAPTGRQGKGRLPCSTDQCSSAVPPQADKGKAASPAPRTSAAQQCPRRQTRERPPPLLHGPVQLSSAPAGRQGKGRLPCSTDPGQLSSAPAGRQGKGRLPCSTDQCSSAVPPQADKGKAASPAAT
ncbi:hypothetical protein P7K49_020744 [Saguinus oedipus]|uniref:Uncharacterized protein n=1 Tax=Saguinus oedipus TaxID=9490 RepID=A0ABQ9URD3_SAGOE|nr:hypothetical protein P7K49_020744 [Saguinus oedipus]